MSSTEEAFRLLSLTLTPTPFKHASATSAFDPGWADRARVAVSAVDSWHPSDLGFSRNSVFHLSADDLPAALAGVLTTDLQAEVHTAMETAFAVALRPRPHLMLNRFEAGDGTLVHNDFLTETDHPYFFTHRCLLYLTQGWDPVMGGVLGVFDHQDSPYPMWTFPPHHNSVFAMAVGPDSHHAVSAQQGPPRYSIVWSFCTRDQVHQR